MKWQHLCACVVSDNCYLDYSSYHILWLIFTNIMTNSEASMLFALAIKQTKNMLTSPGLLVLPSGSVSLGCKT